MDQSATKCWPYMKKVNIYIEISVSMIWSNSSHFWCQESTKSTQQILQPSSQFSRLCPQTTELVGASAGQQGATIHHFWEWSMGHFPSLCLVCWWYTDITDIPFWHTNSNTPMKVRFELVQNLQAIPKKFGWLSSWFPSDFRPNQASEEGDSQTKCGNVTKDVGLSRIMRLSTSTKIICSSMRCFWLGELGETTLRTSTICATETSQLERNMSGWPTAFRQCCRSGGTHPFQQ